MLFKGNSSRLEFLIERIQAHKESPSPLTDEKCLSRSKGEKNIFFLKKKLPSYYTKQLIHK